MPPKGKHDHLAAKITEPHGDEGQPGKYPPLQESFASLGYEDSFDSNNMVWTVQELEHVRETDPEPNRKLCLRTFRTLKYPDGTLRYGCSKGKKLKPPTREGFMRLLDVFGYD